MSNFKPAAWTPDAAKAMLNELWASAQSDDERERLKRLAGCDDARMRGVWDNLPRQPAGLEGALIAVAYHSPDFLFRLALGGKALPTKTGDIKKLALMRAGITMPQSVARIAAILVGDMRTTSEDAKEAWQKHWLGPHGVTFDQALDVVEGIVQVYNGLAADIDALIEWIPRLPTHWKANSAVHGFCADCVSNWIQVRYSSPHDELVAEIIGIILNTITDHDMVKRRRQRRGTK